MNYKKNPAFQNVLILNCKKAIVEVYYMLFWGFWDLLFGSIHFFNQSKKHRPPTQSQLMSKTQSGTQSNMTSEDAGVTALWPMAVVQWGTVRRLSSSSYPTYPYSWHKDVFLPSDLEL